MDYQQLQTIVPARVGMGTGSDHRFEAVKVDFLVDITDTGAVLVSIY
jgi:hypothetical protein